MKPLTLQRLVAIRSRLTGRHTRLLIAERDDRCVLLEPAIERVQRAIERRQNEAADDVRAVAE